MLRATFISVVIATALAAPGPAVAQSKPMAVDLELALGVDVSGSVDEEEARLQREGYIAAFRHPKVVRAIRYGYLGRIAVAYYEWAGFGHMKIIAGWSLISDKKSAFAFADKLLEPPPETARRTAIAAAIAFGITYFDRNGFRGARRVIDISGDGPNNWDPLVTQARDLAAASRLTINGLPIMNGRPSWSGRPPMPDLDLYYRDCVIGGPGAFLVVANDFEAFAAAVLKKLILEIAGTPVEPAPLGPRLAAGHRIPADCTNAGPMSANSRAAPKAACGSVTGG